MAKGIYRDYSKEFFEEITNDFTEACKNEAISNQALYDMAWRVSWELTEWHGADIGCPYWSKEAFTLLKLEVTSSNSNITTYKRPLIKDMKENFKGKIIHEHIVPRIFLTNYIMNCRENKITPETINFKKIIPCIVTKEENKKLDKFKSSMPHSATLDKVTNPWERYIECGITEIYKVTWENDYIATELINIDYFFKKYI